MDSKKPTLPIQKIMMFAETVRQQSITKAAEKLCVTQPAVSTSIKQLEQYFGTKLIEVVRKKIQFTPAAHLLYKHCEKVMIALDNLSLDMESFDSGNSGELRIVMVSSGKYFIPEIIYSFLQHHPKVSFSCDIKRREVITESMENNLYDIAILTDPQHSQHVSQHFLMENPLVFIAHPDHPLAMEPDVSLKSLAEIKFIMREPTALISQILFDLFNKNDLPLDVIFEMDSTEAIKQSVISGLGIALVPRLCVKNELKHGILRIINVPSTTLQNKWFITCSKATEKLTLFKNFLSYLKNSPQSK